MCGIYAGTRSSPLPRLHIYIYTHIYVISFLHSPASFRPCVYASLLFVGLFDGDFRSGSWIRRGSWLRALLLSFCNEQHFESPSYLPGKKTTDEKSSCCAKGRSRYRQVSPISAGRKKASFTSAVVEILQLHMQIKKITRQKKAPSFDRDASQV